jgi:preprotein translocase subunit SecF
MIRASKYKYFTLSLSILLTLAGFAYTKFVHNGFAHSLDFDGGLRAVVRFDKNINRTALEQYLNSKSIQGVIILIDREKNIFQIDIGLDAVDTIKKANEEANVKADANNMEQFLVLIKRDFQLKSEDILSGDQVGSVVGGELFSTGTTLLMSTLAIILLYLSVRFQFKFAVAAIIALLHDLFITLAMIGVFQIKPSVPIIAALLTLLGYSINDTIVVFDRIRENADGNLDERFESLIDKSIYQTLGRTINTSVATLISVVAIVVGGATELFDFAYVLIFGVIVGTYSSIFIAAPFIEIYDKLRSLRS